VELRRAQPRRIVVPQNEPPRLTPWTALPLRPGSADTLRPSFVMRFAPEGRCQEFTEYYIKRP
jgi:hypothetical protein